MSGSYSEAASDYLAAGWTGVLPVPIATKFPPPSGYTGALGADTDEETVLGWVSSQGGMSIALRMPVGMIGIDVDHYDKPKTLPDGTETVVSKRGADTLAEYEAKWGELPATWRSTGRGIDNPSGIRFFRVPAGLKFATVLGDAIEIIQRHHRYAVVAPSAHSTGTVYEWLHPEFELRTHEGDNEFPVPTVAEMPELPAGWVAGLSEHVNQSRTAPAAGAMASALLKALEVDDQPMCSMIEIACNRAVAQLHAASSGSRHDTAMARTMRIIGLGAEGHRGAHAALERARAAWNIVTAGEHRDYEWDSLVAGAAAQAAGAQLEAGGTGLPRELDPCDGASGQGIEVIADPGEGNRVTSLIVEGLDDARMCAEYLGEDSRTTVLGIAGRESWRKAGVPLPELRIVADTRVVILLGPEVVRDRETYMAALDLGDACKAKDAGLVAYAQPTGTIGVRVSAYLNSLEEAERAPALQHMVEVAKEKPAREKPRAAKRVMGDGDASDLPPTNDTFLGTTWADEHLDEYRIVTTDKAWISYRDGRWSVDGAELAVGYSMMRFLHEQSQPISAAMLRAKSGDPEMYEKLQRAYDGIMSTRKRQAVQSAAMVYGPVHVLRDRLDQHPRKFCVANGVLDLDTGEVLPHDPDLLLTTGSDVVYDTDASCPRFDEFLEEVQPDAEVRGYLMRIFAMGLFGEVREHILPVLLGEGRNGKGTMIRIMHEVYGSHADVAEAGTILVRKFDKHEQEVARLAGKRLITIEETTQGAVWNVGRINSWTGGDRLTGRWMGGNNFSFRPSHTLVIATNHRPSVGQGERAFWARYREIPFDVSFEGREDGTLEPYIIANELPGVLNRLIEAGRDYMVHGLREPGAVTMATLDAKVDADSLARFCAEHIAVTHDEADRIPNTELFDLVGKWWSQHVRNEIPPSDRSFPKLMRQALGFPSSMDNPRKLRSGSSVARVWTGIRWLDEGGLSDDKALLPMSEARDRIIGNNVDLNLSTQREGVRTSGSSVADVHDHVADNVADNVDQEIGVFAGPSSTVADVDDVDDKSIRNVVVGEENSETRSNHPVGVAKSFSPSSESSDKGRHRQHRQPEDPQLVPSGIVVLDLETGDVDLQHDHPEPREFVRLAGHSTGNGVITDASTDSLIDHLLKSRYVIGSNIVHFDLPVLSRIDPRVDVLELTARGRVFDTMIAESVLNPILNDKRPNAVGRAMVHFKLDAACERYGIPGKTDNAKALAKEHGGFDQIPRDVLDPYLRGDVEASKGLAGVLMRMMNRAPEKLRNYVLREHEVHAIAAQMGVTGTQVDRALLQRRYWGSAETKSRMTKGLIREFGIPTTLANGKPADSPARTKGGKEALVAAFEALGVPERVLPRTKPSKAHPQGQIAFGGEVMRELAEKCEQVRHPNAEKIGMLCDTIADIGGVRTVYSTALDSLGADGRVHPQVATFQSSGRWSITRPGLTVFGKRGIGSDGKPRVRERAVFTATGPNWWESETTLFAIDLSQVDARSVAVLSQDHAYMDIFGIDPETGEPRDSHAEVALAVWGDRSLRERAKPISHGWNYNMGIEKLATVAGSRSVAEQFDATMRERFPRLIAWKQEMVEIAKSGQMMDNGFGRLMKPDPERAFTQGPALMGQGLARDLMMQCLLNLQPELRRMLRIQVHDEAIFEIPKHNAEEIRREIEAAFNFSWAPSADARPIQLIAEAGVFGYRWSDCYRKVQSPCY